MSNPPFQDRSLWTGSRDAVLDVVANPWTAATFILVTTLGPLAMKQDRFPRIKGATCWVMRDGMQKMYYVGLGISGARAIYGMSRGDDDQTGHSLTLGGMLLATKTAGDRYMGRFLERMGQKMVDVAAHLPRTGGGWLRAQGAAMRDTAHDKLAATGLALCAHSFDEIATLVVSVKALLGWLRAEDGMVEVVQEPAPLPNEDWDGMLPEPPPAMVVAGYAALVGVMAAGAAAEWVVPALGSSVDLPALGGSAPALAAFF